MEVVHIMEMTFTGGIRDHERASGPHKPLRLSSPLPGETPPGQYPAVPVCRIDGDVIERPEVEPSSLCLDFWEEGAVLRALRPVAALGLPAGLGLSLAPGRPPASLVLAARNKVERPQGPPLM